MRKTKHINTITDGQSQVVYRGFDGLDVSFKGALSQDILENLEIAKQKAQDENEKQLVEINGKKLHIGSAGARGGYAYTLDTGELGATWFFKRGKKSDDWNARVSVKSATLAAYGYQVVKKQLYSDLKTFGIYRTQESVGRVDFAIDFLAPGFKINPKNLVTRSHNTQVNVVQKARVVESLTIGKMPNKQVCIYDKTKEIAKKRKNY